MLLYGLYAIESRKCDIQQTEIIMDTCKMRNKSYSISAPSNNQVNKSSGVNSLERAPNRKTSIIHAAEAKVACQESNTKHKSDHALHSGVSVSDASAASNGKSGKKSIVALSSAGRSSSHSYLMSHGVNHESSSACNSSRFQKNLVQFEDYIRKLKESSENSPSPIPRARPNSGSGLSNNKIYKSLKTNRASIVNQTKQKSLNKIEFLNKRQRRNTCSDASLLLIRKDDLIMNHNNTLDESLKPRQSFLKSFTGSTDSTSKQGGQMFVKSKNSSSFSKKILQKQLNSLNSVNLDAKINRLAMEMAMDPKAQGKAYRKMSLAAHHYKNIHCFNPNLPSPLFERSSNSSQTSALDETSNTPVQATTESQEPVEDSKPECIVVGNADDIIYEKKRLQSMCDDLNKIKLNIAVNSKPANLKAYLAKNRKSKSWLSTIFTKFKRSNSTS